METERSTWNLVREKDLASTVKSGSMPVLATPILICWLEQLCFEMLQEQGPSVGYDLTLKHLKPSFLNEEVEVCAEIIGQKKNHVSFKLEAKNRQGELVARGEHKRAFIDPETFLHANR